MNLASRYIKSLLAKPFVILTGNSGSGKSKLAQLFASWLCGEDGYEFVAVGADWTDNRSVLGYANPLRTVSADDTTPIFQATSILKILKLAADDWKANGGSSMAKPWFIILDEMNLSHVERYFSDFLAHMEASEEPLALHHEGKCKVAVDGSLEDLDGTIKIPPNLFVVGTVNVDETTYMFSPKVLDRANVIEFKVTLDALEKAQSGGPSSPFFPPNTASTDFLRIALKARKCDLDPPKPDASGNETNDLKAWQTYKKCIQEVFRILQRRDMEFGFRVQKEMIAYAQADFCLHTSPGGAGHSDGSPTIDWNWRRCFDEQLMQKVLPKFHGDQMKLEAVLSALLRYCEKEDKAFDEAQAEADKRRHFFSPDPPFDELQRLDGADPDPATVRFPLSYAKLCRMKRTLERDQFASYIA